MGYYTYRNESTNITKFGSDGFMRAYGDASGFDDLQNQLIGQKLEVPGSKITQNSAESSITFATGTPITDYVSMSVQMQHSAKTGAVIYPHIHWWQGSSNRPNWYVLYRWQYGSIAKTTTWTQTTRIGEAFTYAAGTINQITNFTAITPTSDQKLSDIVQFRLTRDSNNTSASFASTDVYSGTVDAVSFDFHFEKDTLGSNSEYQKY